MNYLNLNHKDNLYIFLNYRRFTIRKRYVNNNEVLSVYSQIKHTRDHLIKQGYKPFMVNRILQDQYGREY